MEYYSIISGNSIVRAEAPQITVLSTVVCGFFYFGLNRMQKGVIHVAEAIGWHRYRSGLRRRCIDHQRFVELVRVKGGME
jgi:hypothetical protein